MNSFHFGWMRSWKNIFNSLCIGNVWCSWKSWFLTVAHLGRCGGLERTDFEQFVYSEDWSILGRYGGLERTDFETVYILGGCSWSWKNWFLTVSIFRKVWWSWKNWFWTVSVSKELIFTVYAIWSWKKWFFKISILGGCVILKELIFHSFYIRKVCWSWKNWF